MYIDNNELRPLNRVLLGSEGADCMKEQEEWRQSAPRVVFVFVILQLSASARIREYRNAGTWHKMLPHFFFWVLRDFVTARGETQEGRDIRQNQRGKAAGGCRGREANER